MRVRSVLPVLLVVALGVAAPASASGGGPSDQRGRHGLDSPRHLAFGAAATCSSPRRAAAGREPCFSAARGRACMGRHAAR